MSFEIKYDKNGMPLPMQEPAKQDVAQVTHFQQPEPQEPVYEPEEEPQATEEQIAAEVVQTENIAKQAAQESFKAIREKAERLERERNEYMRMFEEEKARKSETPYEDIKVNDDDLVEGRITKQLDAKIKRLEQQLKDNEKRSVQSRQEAALAATEMRLKSQFPDFDRVVSSNTIAALNDSYPELATTISANKDVYSQAVSAYTMIKNLGLYKEDTYMPQKNQAQKNAAKPKPVASISQQKGDSALSNANAFAGGLDNDMRKQMIAEMEAARKLY